LKLDVNKPQPESDARVSSSRRVSRSLRKNVPASQSVEKATTAFSSLHLSSKSLPPHIMRILQFLTAALLSTFALAASKKGTDKFQTFHSKAISSSPIDLDDAGYEHLTSAPRDYSVAVLLTAQEAKYGCQLCRDFHPEWSVLGSSWAKGDKKGESRIIFGTLDFAKGKGTFQKVIPHGTELQIAAD
jgi:hypothetical protein